MRSSLGRSSAPFPRRLRCCHCRRCPSNKIKSNWPIYIQYLEREWEYREAEHSIVYIPDGRGCLLFSFIDLLRQQRTAERIVSTPSPSLTFTIYLCYFVIRYCLKPRRVLCWPAESHCFCHVEIFSRKWSRRRTGAVSIDHGCFKRDVRFLSTVSGLSLFLHNLYSLRWPVTAV